jgi:hypothetical protein
MNKSNFQSPNQRRGPKFSSISTSKIKPYINTL